MEGKRKSGEKKQAVLFSLRRRAALRDYQGHCRGPLAWHGIRDSLTSLRLKLSEHVKESYLLESFIKCVVANRQELL